MSSRASEPSADPRLVGVLRTLLEQSHYKKDAIQDVLGASGDVLARPRERAVYVRRLEGDQGPLATLIRLFLVDEPVPEEAATAALTAATLRALANLGVVRVKDGIVAGQIRLVPHGEILIASDLPGREDVGAEHVAGIHRPSITLADLTVRRPVDAALDMGTGNGIQALLAARHAERVVATDINPRALGFARLNAVLNGVTNVEFREGSFFKPVTGEQFGLVVTNPPYVVSPESALIFRDSGLGRDRVSEQLLRELPSHLEEGGFGTITVSWIQAGDDVASRPRGWLADSGCDAWILHTALEGPLASAANWNRDLADDQERFGEAIDRWVAYYRAEGITALAYGAIILRRRTPGPDGPPNWVRSRELANELRVDTGPHLLRLFSGIDTSLRLADDAALARARVALVDGVSITRQFLVHAGGPDETAGLSMTRGLPFTAALDPFTATFLASLDGSRPLGDVLDEFAGAHDAPVERVRASGIPIVRQLLESGTAEVLSV